MNIYISIKDLSRNYSISFFFFNLFTFYSIFVEFYDGMYRINFMRIVNVTHSRECDEKSARGYEYRVKIQVYYFFIFFSILIYK